MIEEQALYLKIITKKNDKMKMKGLFNNKSNKGNI